MNMINVLQRLAELDAGNPNVDSSAMVATPSLATVSTSLNECGDMPPMPSQPNIPASINITAASGREVSDIIRDIATLAGTTQTPVPVTPPAEVDHDRQIGKIDDFAKTISIIDSLNTDDQDRVDDEDTFEGEEDRIYVNSPDEEIEPHDYGDKQVTPKPQGFKQRMGDNPYKRDEVERISELENKLMAEYRQFVAECDCQTDENIDDVEESDQSNPLTGTLLKTIKVNGHTVAWYRNNDGTDSVYVGNKPVLIKGNPSVPSKHGETVYNKVLDRLH